MLVFVIDDNPDDRALVLHQLKAALPDARPREIGTADQLEGAFAHEKPALVITDLALGWTSGLEVLGRVKALDPTCPVILFTGAGDEQAAVEAMKAGADDYVIKSPKRLARLRSAIRDVVENAARRAPLQLSELSSPNPDQNQRTNELWARVHQELNSVLDRLQTSARQHPDPGTAEQLADVARRLTGIVDLLAGLDRTRAHDPLRSRN